MDLRRICLFLLCLATSGPTASAQAPPKYSNEPFVIESMESRLVYEKDGTGTREITARVRIQSETGVKAFGILNFPYQKDSQDLAVDYVRVVKPDGTVVATPAADIQDLDSEVSRVAPMYSDGREKHVAVKNLAIGDVIEQRSTLRTRKPAAPGQFWTEYSFFRDGIILSEKVEISVPADEIVQVKSGDVKPTVSQEGGRKIYRWATSNLRRKSDQEKAKESKKEPPPPSIQVTTFRTWDEIAKWYADLQRERIQPGPEVRAKALELTRNAKTDVEKLRALYGYISNDFRYIGLEFGVGRYQPHAADEVFRNRYGDCKDKHTLLAAMLDVVGIKIAPVLLNSTRTVDEEVPSPAQFDHVVGVAHVSGEDYWLDTTPEVAPLGMLVYGFRDKRVLVVADKAEWRKTPANAPVETEYTFESKGELKADGQFQGKIDKTVRGDPEIAVRMALRSVGQPQWSELVQQMSNNTGFRGTVSDVDIASAADTEKPVRIRYSYLRKEYSEWLENKRFTPPLPPLGIFPVRNEQDQSDDPITLSGPFTERYRSVMTVPEGYTLTLLPEVNLHTDFADYKAKYQLEGRNLTTFRELTVRPRELPRSRLEEFNKFAKAVVDDESSYLTTRSATADATEEAATAVGKMLGMPSEDAGRLYEQGRSQMLAHNAAGAMESFKKAAEADPKYPGVWTAIGFSYLVQGNPEEAIKALRKEVENHPQDPTANRALAQALFSLRRTEEATEAMRGYVKAAPKDTDAAAALAQNLISMKKYQDAAEVLEAALKESPRNVVLQRQLGNAYAQLGKKDEAVAALHKAVEMQPDDALTMNDAAYYMADANMNLEEAEQWAEKAVKAEVAKTRDLTLENLTVEDLRRVSRLAAYWDTLGWVYFRRGDLQKAEEYLRPAWSLSQAPTMGNHLAQVFEKEGKKTLAAKAYAQSGVSFSPSERGPGVSGDAAGRKHLESLVGAVAAATMINKAGEELSQARSIRTLNFAHGVGSAEFFLLLSPGKKITAKYISGEKSMAKFESALATALAGKLTWDEPGADPVKIVRRAIVICHTSGSYCEVVLMTPDSVTALN